MSEVPQSKEAFEAKYNCKMTITKVADGTRLPCPFCGKSDLSVEPLKSSWDSGDIEDHVVCNNCAASAPVECWQERNV